MDLMKYDRTRCFGGVNDYDDENKIEMYKNRTLNNVDY